MNENNYNSLYQSFRRLHNQLHRLIVSDMQESDMHPGQARLLRVLANHDGATQKELADLMVIRPASMTHLINKLAEQNYIERRENPTDKRSSNIYITEKGKQKSEEIGAAKNKQSELIFSVLNDDEQKELLRLFNKLETEWEQISEEETDYFSLFFYMLYYTPKEEVKALLESNDIDYDLFEQTLIKYRDKQEGFKDALGDDEEMFRQQCKKNKSCNRDFSGENIDETFDEDCPRGNSRQKYCNHNKEQNENFDPRYGEGSFSGPMGLFAFDEVKGHREGSFGRMRNFGFEEMHRNFMKAPHQGIHGSQHGRHGIEMFGDDLHTMHHAGRLRRGIIRSGFDFEALRSELEVQGLTGDKLKDILKQAAEEPSNL